MRRTTSLLLVSLLAACADGGKEDRPASEVRFSASHHLLGFKTLRGFGAFPVQGSVVFPDRAQFNLFDDSSYNLVRSGSTSGRETYKLANDGALSVFVTGGGNEPSTVFSGAYGRVGAANLTAPGATPDFVFTDRVSTPNSQSIGMFYGTKVVDAALDLRGDWHVFSLHVVLGAAVPAPDNVARAVHGNLNAAGLSADANLNLAGTGFQSDSSGVPAPGLGLAGSLRFLLDGATGDGTCNLTLQYDADQRVMRAVTSGNALFALDDDKSDGEAGIALLVREFDDAAPATSLDVDRVDGTFLVGGHTMFINPSNSGSDSFVGTVVLSTNGGFTLDAVGNQGIDFRYTGTWTAQANGKLTFAVDGTNETWHGAIDRSYNTLVLVDDFVVTRSSNVPELNLVLGVRKKVD
ncbi:MAG: hypothetical protein ACK58X_03460 [Planctomycetota bacterium]